MEQQKNFDFYLKNALSTSGMSREELAQHLGVAVPVVNRWLNGASVPDVEQFREIAHYLGLSYEWFLDGKSDTLDTAELAARLGLPEVTVKALLALAKGENTSMMDSLNDAICAMVSAIRVAYGELLNTADKAAGEP